MEWISIKERLPNEDETYNWLLVASDQDDGAIAWYIARWMCGKFEFWDDSKSDCVSAPYCGDASTGLYRKNITHWMPIEQLPEAD